MKVLPKYRDTLFTRLILSYTALAAVLIGLVGGYLYTQANQMMIGEISRDSQSRLVTTKDFVERTLLRKYEDNIQNKALSTIFIQNSSNLNVLLDHGWKGNLSRIVSVRQDLDMFKTAFEGVTNLTIYFREGNYVVDSGLFYMKPENSYDFAFIKQLQHTDTNRWIIRTLPGGKRTMTYVVKLPYGTIGALPKGYLFVDVDLDYVKQTVAKIVNSPYEKLFIFDTHGKVIIQTAAANPDEIRLLQDTIGSGEVVKEVSDNKRGTVVLSHLDEAQSKNGLIYAIVRPIDSFVLASKQLKTKIFVGCSLVLAFGLLISYLISKRFYIPMKKLILHIRSLYQPIAGSSNANEYMIIDSALNFMGQKISTLESQARKNEMKNLVLGANLDLEYMDGLRQDCCYLVSHIQFLEGNSENFKARYEYLSHKVHSELVCLNPQEAAIITFVDSRGDVDDKMIAAELERVQEELREEFRFGAGIGSLAGSPEEIQISYEVAQQAYRYRFMYGPEAVVLHSKVSSFDSKPHLFSLEIYQNALKAGDVDGVNRFIDEFFAVLKERSLRLESVELALLQVVSALYQTVIDLNLQQLVPPSDLFDELKKETLADTIGSIRGLSERIGVHVRDSGNHAHTEVIYKLKTYIDEHLEEELSLNVLSEVASLAPAYISTLFGEVMNETFTEYVTRTRLDKAGGLLRENDRLSVTEIAVLVGYRNPQYFHNKFKSRFGVTPLQYRQAAKHAVGMANEA